MEDTIYSNGNNKTNPRIFDHQLNRHTKVNLSLENFKMATSVRNRPTMHCKPLSIEYIVYVYGLCLFYLILRLAIYI